MTDRPILFSAPMVRALLEGRKTQTRRVIKPQPIIIVNEAHTAEAYAGSTRIKAGDRLWVRETWRAHGWYSDCVEIAYAAQRGSVGWTEQVEQIRYPNGDKNAFKYYAPDGPYIWRPSTRKPDAHSTAIEWGCDWGFDGDSRYGSPVCAYSGLWDHINGPGAWSKNPWVVAYTFDVIKQNIDRIEQVAA